MKYQLDFNDKVVAITGASRGIGRSIAVGFGSLGANVILISRNKEKLEETATQVKEVGGEANIIVADLTNLEQIKEVVNIIKQDYSRLDVLVNNAGIARRKPSVEVSEDDWDTILDTNLKSYFFMSTLIAKELMMKQGHGKIVNVASIGGIVGITRSAPYSSSKGGVVLLTKVLGCEWAKYNIQVNAVGPAYTNTELIAKAIQDKEFLDTIISRTPAKRLAEPEEIVGGVLYLASDLANYVTGHTLLIDGGLTAFGV
ncbi:SDR family NAD(P)-dependent oxidoreductase [Thermoanaerobacteraceae bacterium SP2]|nr:SDR family NAD(P)-dependent oxidoreductase [Thermoanaerobacteraceae bacterium SP2]